MIRSVFALIVAATLLACGGPSSPPKRLVVEGDIDAWGFRRYQAVLEPEVWIKGNPATGHTASYARKQAEKRGRLDDGDVIHVFVTRFRSGKGLVAALTRFVRRLAQESGYVVDEKEIGGTRFFVVSGHGERWSWWPSRRYLIKIGGRGVRGIPKGVVKEYANTYPSRLQRGDLDAPLEEEKVPEVETEAYDPGNPTPDFERGEDIDRQKQRRRRRKGSRRRGGQR